MESMLLDAAGHRRSPATMPGYHRGRPPGNKGEQYPADPPTVEEIVAVMRAIGDRAEGQRLRALIVLLWRAGLRISEALALQECDLDRSRGAVIVRRGKAASGERLGRTAGHGSSSVRGWRFVAGSRSARCCALSTDRPPDAGGRRRLPASSCTMPPAWRASDGGSHPTNSGTPTRSKWRMKAFRSLSSSVSWGMPTWDHQHLPAGHR
jgi:hypothetical protein